MRLKLEDNCRFINGGSWTANEYADSGYPVLKVSNFDKASISYNDLSYLQESSFVKYKKNQLKLHDIVIATVGSHPSLVNSAAGRCITVPEDAVGLLLNQNALCLRTKNEDVIDQRYLGYLCKSQLFQHFIQQRGKGAANQMRIPIGGIKSFEMDFPKIETQRKIASILSAYDDLIENNLKRIKLLEEQAQQTYEEWFVRFKFPGYENVEVDEESGLPVGWSRVKASERIKLISGYTFKGKEFTDIPNDDIAVRMGNFKVGGGLKFDKSKYLINSSEVREKFHLKHNDLLMVLSDVTREGLLIGNVGFVPIDGRNYYLNQRVSKVVTEDDFKMYAYAVFNSAAFKHNCISKANSVTVLNLKNDDVYSFKMLIPSKEIIELWNKIYGSSIKMTQNLERQNQHLIEALNILLPRLMSGMIDVEQLEVGSMKLEVENGLGMVAEEQEKYTNI